MTIVDFGAAAGAPGAEPPGPGGTAGVGAPRPGGWPAAAGADPPAAPVDAPGADGVLLPVDAPEPAAPALLADPPAAPVGAACSAVDCVARRALSEPDAPGSDVSGTGAPPAGIAAAAGSTPPAGFSASWTRVPHPPATSTARTSGIQARHDFIVSLLGVLGVSADASQLAMVPEDSKSCNDLLRELCNSP